ncbi:MAG: PhoH family protein [Candidatus Tectomicrobia bacterium]|uniref:PhoH-like protein n=1 Tax=Tectimicrobiota bacterium TaxID=2528274 RepID=A0A932I4N0_UNCTE|nr:PhoH family protein [Candidatus Tectomicrobia bacterium]
MAIRTSASPLAGPDRLIHIIGNRDESLRAVEKAFGVKIRVTSEGFSAEGESAPVDAALRFLDDLQACLEEGVRFDPSEVATLVRAVVGEPGLTLRDLAAGRISVSSKRRYIIPKSPVQRDYLEAIRQCDVVFGIGPAGTGKTYLAMAAAVSGLLQKAYSRIVLTRPVVEAGEKLGFLPGDLQEKVNPYLRPLFDALNDMVEFERAERLIQRGEIEVAPLAYMRGRSLNDSFIILDEAQNTTPEQMKMFLTRLGTGSKAIVTGDITQIDLPESAGCGLIHVHKVLTHLEEVRFIFFTERDVVRTPLVRKIVSAYEATRV